jgi:biotin transport system substrate-specific component
LRAREHTALVEDEQSALRRLAVHLAAVTAFAALTALSARVQVRLPFTPVPVTGQVFCVLLAGAVLGPRLGFVSQVQYLAAGAAGLPVFAHGGGPAALLGPTGGYLVGFPLAAAVVGALYGRAGSWSWLALPACLSGVAVIYTFGAAWYVVWTAALGGAVALPVVLAQSVFPFVPFDAAKAFLVAAAAPWLRRWLPLG